MGMRLRAVERCLPYGSTQCYPTQVNVPHLNPGSQTDLIYLPQEIKGGVDLGGAGHLMAI